VPDTIPIWDVPERRPPTDDDGHVPLDAIPTARIDRHGPGKSLGRPDRDDLRGDGLVVIRRDQAKECLEIGHARAIVGHGGELCLKPSIVGLELCDACVSVAESTE
jgi:hypothetical protein